MTDTPDLVVTQTIDAPPEVVFPFFTDAEQYARWMGTDVTIEATPGGTYRAGMREGLAAAGAFVEVDPPHRVVFTWGWEDHPLVPPGSSTVQVVLTAAAGGGTLVTLTHRGIPTEDERLHHGEGWRLYLSRLAVVAAGGDPGPDPNATEGA